MGQQKKELLNLVRTYIEVLNKCGVGSYAANRFKDKHRDNQDFLALIEEIDSYMDGAAEWKVM
jgi:hypothetical protein